VKKIKLEKEIAGKKQTRIVGVEVDVSIFKSSIWKPFRTAPISIIFNYGIDDVKENLAFIKENTGSKVYTLGGSEISNSMNKAISIIEKDNLEVQLKNEVIDLWETVEKQFTQERKPRIF
jgi:hypothetical protein